MSRKTRFQPTLARYQSRYEASEAEESSRERFTLRIVTARAGGEATVTDLPATFATFSAARSEADRLQDEHGDDPVDVYVIDPTGVPIHRGGARVTPPQHGCGK